MVKASRYKCVMCGKVVKAKKPRRTCSDKCRVAYFRHIQDGGEERPINCLDKETVTASVTAKSPVTQTPPSHEQTDFKIPSGYKLIDEKTHERLLDSHLLMTDLIFRGAIDPSLLQSQKKSDSEPSVVAIPEVPIPHIDPPVVIYDEEAAKRRTIENTLKSIAALDDF